MKSSVADQALRGHGPLFDAILDERARQLAEPLHAETVGTISVLLCEGRGGRWAIPINAISTIVGLTGWTPVPRRRPPILGLAFLAGDRVLLADLDSLAAGVPLRDEDRPGHAIVLREGGVAVAVDRAEAVTDITVLEGEGGGTLGRGMTADGDVLLDAGAMVAEILARGKA